MLTDFFQFIMSHLSPKDLVTKDFGGINKDSFKKGP